MWGKIKPEWVQAFEVPYMRTGRIEMRLLWKNLLCIPDGCALSVHPESPPMTGMKVNARPERDKGQYEKAYQIRHMTILLRCYFGSREIANAYTSDFSRGIGMIGDLSVPARDKVILLLASMMSPMPRGDVFLSM